MRDIVFVCAVVRDGELVSKTIVANSAGEAQVSFREQFHCDPQEISGPFYHKKGHSLQRNTDIRFRSTPQRSGVYRGWAVQVMELTSPPNCGFVIFDRRTDAQPAKRPSTTVVRMDEIEFPV